MNPRNPNAVDINLIRGSGMDPLEYPYTNVGGKAFLQKPKCLWDTVVLPDAVGNAIQEILFFQQGEGTTGKTIFDTNKQVGAEQPLAEVFHVSRMGVQLINGYPPQRETTEFEVYFHTILSLRESVFEIMIDQTPRFQIFGSRLSSTPAPVNEFDGSPISFVSYNFDVPIFFRPATMWKVRARFPRPGIYGKTQYVTKLKVFLEGIEFDPVEKS